MFDVTTMESGMVATILGSILARQGAKVLVRSTVAAALLAAVSITPALGAKGGADGAEPPAHAAYLAIDYANTERGIVAKLTVRSCARSEAPSAEFEIRETLVATPDDIVVRMVDADGHEISRTAGSTASCQYGRFAAAYFARLEVRPKP